MSTTHQGRHAGCARTGAAIEVTELVKTYGKGKRVVRAVDGATFAVPSGTVVGLLGPNGAGKSTTVRILATLSKADGGRATVAGVDVTREPAAVRHLLGYVPQRPSFDPTATGRENLRLQARAYGLGSREAHRRCHGLLERFDLASAADRLAKTWSGGMQRKLDVALGLVHRPQVLLLDEPTTGLDPEARARLWEEIGRLSAAEGLSVLFTTHYLDEADLLAEQVVIVDRGRVVASGVPEALKAALGGDTVEIEVTGAQLDVARGVLEEVTGARAEAEGTSLRVGVAGGAAALAPIVAALARAGVQPAALALSRPRLDDVYLHHAGRSFRAADAVNDQEVA